MIKKFYNYIIRLSGAFFILSNFLLGQPVTFDISKYFSIASSVPETLAQFTSNGGRGGEGDAGVGTGTCMIASGSQFLTIENGTTEGNAGTYCCSIASDCSAYFSGKAELLAGKTWSCQPGLACENSTQTGSYIIISKSGPDKAEEGEPVAYSIVISNIGSGALLGFNFFDHLPLGFVFSGATSGSYNTGTHTLLHSLNLSGHASFSIAIDGYFDTGGVFNNSGGTSISDPDATGENCSDYGLSTRCFSQSVQTIVPYYNTDIIKSVSSGNFEVGDYVRYTITVANSGNDTINKTIEDLVTGCVQYISHQLTNGTYNSSNGIWSITNLDSGSAASLIITGLVVLSGASSGLCTNIAILTGDQYESGNSAQASFIAYQKGLSLSTVLTPGSGTMSGGFVYYLTVTNNSNYIYTGVELTGNPGATFVFSGTPSLSNLSIPANSSIIVGISGNYYTGSYSGLTLTGTTSIIAGSKIANGVLISHSFCDPLYSCNDSDAVILYKQQPKLHVTKVASVPVPLEIGDDVIYMIGIGNSGGTTLNITSINDVLPAGLVVTSTGTPSLPFSLAPNTAISYTVVGYRTETGAKTSTITVGTDNTAEDCAGASVCSANVSNTVLERGLIITKYADPVAGYVGQYIRYTLFVTNDSKYPFTNVKVEDLFPSDYIGGSFIPSQGSFSFNTNIWNLGNVPANTTTGISLVFTGYFTGAGLKTNTGRIYSGYKVTPHGNIGTGYCVNCTGTVDVSISGICQSTILFNNNYKLISYVYPNYSQVLNTTSINFTVVVTNIGGTSYNGTLNFTPSDGSITPGSANITLAPGASYQTTVTMNPLGTYGALPVGITVDNTISGYNQYVNIGLSNSFNTGTVITKHASPNTFYVSPGQLLSYSLRIINLDVSSNFDGYVVDILPTLFQLTGDNPPNYDPNNGFVDNVNLNPQENVGFIINGYFETGGSNRINTAQLYNTSDTIVDTDSVTLSVGGGTQCTGSDSFGGGGGGGGSGSGLPDLRLYKTGSITKFNTSPNALLYTLYFGNSGGSASNVEVIDYFPTGFVLTGALLNNLPFTYTTGNHYLHATGLSLGYLQTGKIDIFGYFSGNFSSGQLLRNTGTIYYYTGIATGAETEYGYNTGIYDIYYISGNNLTGRTSGLIIIKNVTPGSGIIGSYFLYTITIGNNSSSNVSNVLVVEQISTLISQGFTGITAQTSTGAYTNSNGQWNIPYLAINDTANLLLSGYFTNSGTKVNVAVISGCSTSCTGVATGYVVDSGSAIVSSGYFSNIQISKAISKAVASVGEVIAYIISIQNLNNFDISNLYMQENLPIGSGFTGISWYASTGSYNTGTQIWYIPGITSGGGASLIVSGYFIYTGQFTNTVTLSGCMGTGCTGSVSGIVTDLYTGICNASINNNTYYSGSLPSTGSLCSSGLLSGLVQNLGIWVRSCAGSGGGASQNGCNFGVMYCGDGNLNSGEQCEVNSSGAFPNGCTVSCMYNNPICNGLAINPSPSAIGAQVTVLASGSSRANNVLYDNSITGVILSVGSFVSYSTAFNNTGVYHFVYEVMNPLSGSLVSYCSGYVLVSGSMTTGQCNTTILSGTYYSGSIPSTGLLCSSGSLTNLIQNNTGRTWSCSGSNGGASQLSCVMSIGYCGDGVIQISNGEQCEIGQSGCNSMCSYATPICYGFLISPNPVASLQNVTIYASGSNRASGSLYLGSTGGTVLVTGTNISYSTSFINTGSYNLIFQLANPLSGTIVAICSGFNTNVIVTDQTISGVCTYTGASFYQSSLPSTGILCTSGALSGLVQNSGSRTRSCLGINSGAASFGCNLTILNNPITGSCNASGSYASGALPSTGSLCSSGSLSGLIQGFSGRTWSCLGSGGGNASCNLNITGIAYYTGTCGLTGTYITGSVSMTGLCSSGYATSVNQTSGSLSRTCQGAGGAPSNACTIGIDDPYQCGGYIVGTFSGTYTGITVILTSGGLTLYTFNPVITGNSYTVPIDYLNTGSIWYVQSGSYIVIYQVFSGVQIASGSYPATITNTCPGVLSISKTVNRVSASIGDTLTRTILYSNLVSGFLYNVTLNDLMPSVFTITNVYSSKYGNNTGYTVNGPNDYSFNLGTLSDYASGSIVFTTLVNTSASTGSTYTNILSGSDSGLSNALQGTASVYIGTLSYTPTLPNGVTYEPVPLPEPPFVPAYEEPLVVQTYIKKTRKLLVRARDYVPFYTQAVAVVEATKKTPDTGADDRFRTLISNIVEFIRKI